MRRILFLILCLFIFFGSAYAQRMSDEQVVEYVKQAQAAGKSQKQMTAELLRRGVTREQVLRIKDKYENSGVAVPGSEAPSQMRKRRLLWENPTRLPNWMTRKRLLMRDLKASPPLRLPAYRFSVIICSRTVISPLNLV